MASQWLKARQTRYTAYAVVYILVVLVAVVVANVLANRYDKSWDATKNKQYSLSQETAKLVKGVKQPVTITYFNQSTRFGEGKDLLDEYKVLSPNVHVDYVDPEKEPMVAREDGVQSMGSAVVQVGDKKEIAASMDETGITGALIRDIKTSTRTICFVSGSGEHQIDDSGRDGLSKWKDELTQDTYETKTINLITQAQVPSDCTALVIAGPTHNYDQPEVAAIQNYVQNGGRAMILLDPPFQVGNHPIADNDGLTSMLAGWGVTADKDVIVDPNPIGQLMGMGPQVALVTTYQSQPIVADLKRTVTGFPLARSLQVHDAAKTSVQTLFDSSDTSLATSNLSSATFNPNDPNNKKGPMVLAAAGTYDTGKEGSQGRFVVVGNSDWAANFFITFNGNSDLALNAINWLASDEDLISIRPKPPADQHITMTRAQSRMVILTSQFVLPLIVIFCGVFVWWKRR
ncbi:MAG TPA: GldG family protein [Terracidiphilus sp.]|nr:GldG family protein [Terracidiphilus sp.]